MLLLLLISLLSLDPFRVRVNKHVGFAPLSVEGVVVAQVPNQAFIESIIESDNMRRTSMRPADGKRLFVFNWVLEQGEYEVTFRLLDAEGRVLVSKSGGPITVLGKN